MLPEFARFTADDSLSNVLAHVSSRPPAQFHDDVVLVDARDSFLGLIAVRDLIRLQNRLLLSNIRELRASRDEIDRRNREMHQDLLMARQLQRAILPDLYPEFGCRRQAVTRSLQFHHRYEPAGEVGGDFLQIVRLSAQCAGIFICDVMGHGVRSALVTAMLRALMEELKALACEPGRTLTQMNRDLGRILQKTDSPMFATALYAVVDLGTGTIRLAKAGHPDALRFDAARSGFEWLRCIGEAAGPALGFFPDAVYGSAEFALGPGDRLLFFTDGLIEVSGPDGEEFGEAGLIALASGLRRLAMPRLCDELLESVRRFAAVKAFSDDVCLLGIEVETTDE
jgi:serine phosphatase RsbU (regulator of sigma subunit)